MKRLPVNAEIQQRLLDFLSKDPYARSCLLKCSIGPQIQVDRLSFLTGECQKGTLSQLCVPLIATAEATNVYGTMHGGVFLSLTDIIASMHAHCVQNGVEVSAFSPHTLDTHFASSIVKGRSFSAISTLDHISQRNIHFTVKFLDVETEKKLFAKGTVSRHKTE